MYTNEEKTNEMKLRMLGCLWNGGGGGACVRRVIVALPGGLSPLPIGSSSFFFSPTPHPLSQLGSFSFPTKNFQPAVQYPACFSSQIRSYKHNKKRTPTYTKKKQNKKNKYNMNPLIVCVWMSVLVVCYSVEAVIPGYPLLNRLHEEHQQLRSQRLRDLMHVEQLQQQQEQDDFPPAPVSGYTYMARTSRSRSASIRPLEVALQLPSHDPRYPSNYRSLVVLHNDQHQQHVPTSHSHSHSHSHPHGRHHHHKTDAAATTILSPATAATTPSPAFSSSAPMAVLDAAGMAAGAGAACASVAAASRYAPRRRTETNPLAIVPVEPKRSPCQEYLFAASNAYHHDHDHHHHLVRLA